MSPDTLHSGAFLVADAHCAPWRTPFLDFLRALDAGKLQTPQLILMGDVFDLLFGPVEATCRLNADAVSLINRISEKIDVVYLEGNHDFALAEVFPKVRVFSRAQQPWIARYGEKTVALSHGDTRMGIGYELYTALIRSTRILKTLARIDRIGKGFIVRALEKAMRRKNHCREIEGFEPLIRRRLGGEEWTGIDVVIEGHFHQNRAFSLEGREYVNLAAFACNERYFSVQSSQNQPLLHEAVFRKEPL
ncbi:MAG: metallophosphoesterase [Campylobacterota bacterium]